MMKHAPARHHSRCADDDARAALVIKSLRFVARRSCKHVARAQWIDTMSKNARIILVLLLLSIAVSLRRRRSHRRINSHRQDRNAFLLFKLAYEIDDLLRATNRKRRNQYRAVPLDSIV